MQCSMIIKCNFEVLCKGCLPSYLALLMHIQNPLGVKDLQVFNLHPNPFSLGSIFTARRRLICEQVRKQRMGFQPEKSMKT